MDKKGDEEQSENSWIFPSQFLKIFALPLILKGLYRENWDWFIIYL